MRELASENFAWALYEDEATGLLHVEFICNQSAFYFAVVTTLVPDEAAKVVQPAGPRVTEAGRQLLERLGREAQGSPAKFEEKRRAAWRALDRDVPVVPPLRPA
jgi:hypothetical protein